MNKIRTVAIVSLSSGMLGEDFARHEREIGSGLIWDCDEHQRRSDRENMLLLLDYIKNKFGSIEGYLRSVGMTEEELEALRGLLK